MHTFPYSYNQNIKQLVKYGSKLNYKLVKRCKAQASTGEPKS
jgi:hypothetical protein